MADPFFVFCPHPLKASERSAELHRTAAFDSKRTYECSLSRRRGRGRETSSARRRHMAQTRTRPYHPVVAVSSGIELLASAPMIDVRAYARYVP